MKKRYLIIHADDAGLALSHNRAIQEGMLRGSISSCSLMVPTPWFFEMAKFCLDYPALDYGIHLTLTGEWKHYPFRPLSPLHKIPSLITDKEYFHSSRKPFETIVKAEEVYIELKSQIDHALNLGLKPSHLDSHMYTLGLRQDLMEVYIQLGKDYKLPILCSSTLVEYEGGNSKKISFNQPEWKNIYIAHFEHFKNESLTAFYDKVIDNLPVGLSQILIHPAYLSASMKCITHDHPNFGAAWRAEDAIYFLSKSTQQKIKDLEIELVGWKEVMALNLLNA